MYWHKRECLELRLKSAAVDCVAILDLSSTHGNDGLLMNVVPTSVMSLRVQRGAKSEDTLAVYEAAMARASTIIANSSYPNPVGCVNKADG